MYAFGAYIEAALPPVSTAVNPWRSSASVTSKQTSSSVEVFEITISFLDDEDESGATL